MILTNLFLCPAINDAAETTSKHGEGTPSCLFLFFSVFHHLKFVLRSADNNSPHRRGLKPQEGRRRDLQDGKCARMVRP
jgi:hypothetical protein